MSGSRFDAHGKVLNGPAITPSHARGPKQNRGGNYQFHEWAVRGFFGLVPADDSAEVGADGGAGVDRAGFVLVTGELGEAAAEDATLADTSLRSEALFRSPVELK